MDLRPGGFNILTSVDGGAANLVASGVVQSRGFSPAAITAANFGFDLAAAGSTLQVNFTSGGNPDVMTVLNGLRITAVPEPSCGLLVGLVLPLVRRRAARDVG